MAKEVKDIKLIHLIVLFPFVVLLRLWCLTLKEGFVGDPLPKERDRPYVITLWHNRIFLTGHVSRKFFNQRPITALVSASGDGAWLAAFYKLISIKSARGSSSRNSLSATKVLVKAVKAGSDLAITPDGPRGPKYKCKQGPVVLAKMCKAKLCFLNITFHNAWQLKTWDEFYIPKPFSRITYGFSVFDSVDALLEKYPAYEATEAVDQELHSLKKD